MHKGHHRLQQLKLAHQPPRPEMKRLLGLIIWCTMSFISSVSSDEPMVSSEDEYGRTAGGKSVHMTQLMIQKSGHVVKREVQGRSQTTSWHAMHQQNNDDEDDNSAAVYGHPFFGKTNTQVLVQEGSHAFFHCPVHNVGNQTVSWVRNSDSHILFIGLDRFVHEDRYELIPARHGRWTLKVEYVTAKDSGKFECQVSTVPKINQTFTLRVIVPYVKIVGDREVYVKSGSSVTLRCMISNCLEEPSYVFWYYADSYRILDDSDRIPSELVATSTTTTTTTMTSLAQGSQQQQQQQLQRRRQRPRKNKSRGTLSKYVETLKRNGSLLISQTEKFASVFARGGIRIRTRVMRSEGSAISQITIRHPTPHHSGKYSCRPANLEPAHVKLHVIQDEKPAAMQHDNSLNQQQQQQQQQQQKLPQLPNQQAPPQLSTSSGLQSPDSSQQRNAASSSASNVDKVTSGGRTKLLLLFSLWAVLLISNNTKCNTAAAICW